MSPTPRPAIVGPHASLKFGGEAMLPWYYFKFLRARGVDAQLIVHGCTFDELAREFHADMDRVHTVSDTRLDRFLFALGKFMPRKVDALTLGVFRHWVTQLRQKKILRRLIAADRINIVSEVSPVSPKHVSAMYGLGVPVVMGPLSGGMTFPPGFEYMESRLTRSVEIVGRAFSHGMNLLIPGRRRADAVILANAQSRHALPMGVRARLYEMPDIGVDLTLWTKSESSGARDGPPRFSFLGRLADWKGVNFLVDAMKQVTQTLPDAHLDIIGDGPMRSSLQAQIQQLGLEKNVTFHGYVLPPASTDILRKSVAMVLPSLHECGGIVVLESMAVGVPVIATNWGGPSIFITDESGVRVNPDSPTQFVKGLAQAMVRLASDPAEHARLVEGGLRHVRQGYFDWSRKVDRLMEIYSEMLTARAARSRR